MLWAYFDESGIHAPDGSLTKLTVGGMIASFESWERLSSRWSRALAAMDLPYFHMAHFQARKPPYSNWTEEERRDRLNTLLEIIGEPDRHGYGFTNIARGGDTTRSLYERCAHDLLLKFGTMSMTSSRSSSHIILSSVAISSCSIGWSNTVWESKFGRAPSRSRKTSLLFRPRTLSPTRWPARSVTSQYRTDTPFADCAS
jgi:hypothetical protein